MSTWLPAAHCYIFQNIILGGEWDEQRLYLYDNVLTFPLVMTETIGSVSGMPTIFLWNVSIFLVLIDDGGRKFN